MKMMMRRRGGGEGADERERREGGGEEMKEEEEAFGGRSLVTPNSMLPTQVLRHLAYRGQTLWPMHRSPDTRGQL